MSKRLRQTSTWAGIAVMGAGLLPLLGVELSPDTEELVLQALAVAAGIFLWLTREADDPGQAKAEVEKAMKEALEPIRQMRAAQATAYKQRLKRRQEKLRKVNGLLFPPAPRGDDDEKA